MIDKDFCEVLRAVFPKFDGNLTRETTAAEVPGWDSFGHVQLIFELEDRYSCRIDPQRALSCKNVGELLEMLGK
jgi:acyl carrier protein